MMELICHIALLILCAIAFYQDWKFRAISWMVFPLLLITTLALFKIADIRLLTIGFNLFFLGTILLCLFIYISLQRKKLTNIFKSDLGIGDVLFLIAITPLFIDRNFVLFFITGMLLSGIVHLILYTKTQNAKIPLAGYLALYLIALKTADFFTLNDLFYNPIL